MGHRYLISGRNRSAVTTVYCNSKSLFSTTKVSDDNVAEFRKVASGKAMLGRKHWREKLWREFFSDPSQWWDNRSDKADHVYSDSWCKVNARYPDFTHKRTKEALWVEGNLTPPWVQVELAALAPGSVQLNTYSWNKSLVRCVKAGQYEKTVKLFEELQQEGINPDRFTFTPVINACTGLRALELGRQVHSQTIQAGCASDLYVGNSLIDMYAKCGSIEDSWRVFNQMPARDVVSWSSIIQGHVKCGKEHKALELFQQMRQEMVDPAPATFLGVLNACASLLALDVGRHVHEEIIQRGFESNVYVGSCLVDMYAKCGSIEDALIVFNKMPTRNVVAWNALIIGHVKCGQGYQALKLSRQMIEEGIIPVRITFVAMLNACASVMALQEGRLVHEQVIQSGYESDGVVCNSLIDMYTKCRSMEDAWRVFNKMRARDVYGWSAIILGHVKCGEGKKALELFQQMQREGVDPDPVSFVGVLNACSSVVALEEGRRLHEQIATRGYERDVFVGSSLVDMYAKCGSIEDAIGVFNKMPTHNAVSWTAMLGGFAIHGQWKEAFLHFEQMCQEGVQLDTITLIPLLSACCHGGLVDEALHYLKLMSSDHSILPDVEHYACMVDLLGRAGRLHEAEELIKTLPFKPNATVWTALLDACRVHGNVEMGEGIVDQVVELDPANAAGYVLLSDMYCMPLLTSETEG